MSKSVVQTAAVLTNTPPDTLQDHQQAVRRMLGITPPLSDMQAMERALAHAKLYAEQSTRDGEFIRIGILKYPAELEELRWRQTDNVIRRLRPGLDEDPVYLAMLAREAASVEIAIAQSYTKHPSQKAVALWPHIFLGTTAQLYADARSKRSNGDVVVLLCSGLIDFLYQASKAVLLSWPRRPAKPGVTISLSTKLEEIERGLETNPLPLELLSKTLDAYIFEGRPRAADSAPPPPEYCPPLGLQTNLNERFTVAHEYGHDVMKLLQAHDALPPIMLESLQLVPHGNPSWEEEFQADCFAFVFALLSAVHLDVVPPNVALQGAFFVLQALEVLRRTLDTVRYGAVRTARDTDDHPPYQRRVALLMELYNLKNQALVKNSRLDLQRCDLGIEGASAPATTLDYLWSRIQNHFVEAWQKGKRPHEIWGL